jgi:phosphate transport system substrate-binding protein
MTRRCRGLARVPTLLQLVLAVASLLVAATDRALPQTADQVAGPPSQNVAARPCQQNPGPIDNVPEIPGVVLRVSGDDVALRISGDDVAGQDLILPIAHDYLVGRGGSAVHISDAPPPWRWQVSGDSLLGGSMSVLVRGSGSTDGLRMLSVGDADIAVVGRELDPPEEEALSRYGNIVATGAAYPLARYAVVPAVQQDNPIEEISFDHLRDVFAGRLSDWSELGGPAGPIQLYGREEGTAIRRLFCQMIMGDVSFSPSLQTVLSYKDLYRAIANNRAAIGLLPQTPSFRENVKPLPLVLNGRHVQSDFYAIATGDYPLLIPVTLFRRPGDNSNLESIYFYSAAGSAGSQVNIAKQGYASLEPRLLLPSIDLLAAQEYEAGTSLRVSTTIRFPPDVTELDLRSKLGLDEVARYLRGLRPGASHLLYVGFSDYSGDAQRDQERARELATIVAKELEERDVARGSVLSLGARFPLASDFTAGGRRLNRRVEIRVRAGTDTRSIRGGARGE